MTALVCDHCGQPVLLALNSRVLTPKPTRLGIYHPHTGETLTTRHIAQLIRDHGHAGHSNHHCPPPAQGDLFDTAQEAI